MDYQKHYELLLLKHGSWEKPKGVYTERHRKIPGYLGGKYVKGNAFYVSARVHYLAHVLWAKITEHEDAWLTVKLMRRLESGKTSKRYEEAKLKSMPKLLEYLSKARKISGDNAVAMGKGVHGADKEQRKEWAKNAGKISVSKRVGVHGADSNTLSDWGKKASRIRYRCDECGMETTCGAMGRHTKKTGHTKKTRIDNG